MNDNSAAQELKMLIEATLLAAGRPLTIAQLLELFDERERPSDELMQEALTSLAGDYENRGIELREVATGWRIQIKAKCVDIVSRLWQERASRYSRALLETLALIAYRQPITRSEIEEIRGVAISSSIMRTIQERNWIRIVGHREVPGRPELLGTTKEFLDYFGLRSLDQLPTLAELRDVENVGVQLELPSAEVAITDANDLVATNDDADASDDGDVIDKVADTQAADDIDADVGDADADADTENLDAADELEDGESSDSTTMVAESDESAPPMYAPAPESND